MARLSPFDSLMGGFAFASATEPTRVTRQKLLALTGVTDSQLSYYIRLGAVSGPNGRTRAAYYTMDHVKQVKRVVHLLKQPEWTVQQVAEAFKKSSRAYRKEPSAKPERSAVEHETVHHINENIRIVVSQHLLDTDRVILRRLLKASEMSIKERRHRLLESLRLG